MKTRLSYIILFFVLSVVACAPLPTAPGPTPVTTEVSPVPGLAIVQSVEVQILENSPIKANAIVRGQLPDSGCTAIASVNQVRDANTIRLTLSTATDPLALCAAALTPFEHVVALDTNDLPPARYIVNANGIEASFVLLTRDLSAFNHQLVEALNAQDYELLRLMMDKSFMIGYWRSEGTSLEVEPAIEQLRQNYLNGSASINADPAKNLIELLGGIDPIAILGPDAGQAHALYVSGWGLAGKDEALLFVATLPDGSLYWHGILVAKDGFAEQIPVTGPNPPVDTNAYATDIQYIFAQQDAAMHSGPGSNFAVLGKLYAGQIALVTGINVNGSWWQVVCPNNTTGSCWISADRNLTRPTNLPRSDRPSREPEKIPTISIVEVVRDSTVTIKTHNYPANTKFQVRMGKMGTKGIGGILVDTFNSKSGGSFNITFDIPWKLYGEEQIAIRIESSNGYYSYNWFENTKTGAKPNPDDPKPTPVQYILAQQDVSIRNGPGKKYVVIGWIAGGQTAKVTAVSMDDKWWRVICPDNSVGNCWVSADPNLTRPTDLSGNADVQSVQIQILESYPLQVNAIARGQLPDAGCTTIAGASQVRSSNTIKVSVTTKTDPLALCGLALTPFEYVIALDVGSLLPARYIVNVNGVEESFELPESYSPTDVKYVMAQRDVSMYSGPGTQFSVISSIAAGQTAKVTGVNASGSWWRVICPDDTVGNCWVSADPVYTLPAQPPG